MNQYIKIKESIISIIDLFENPNSSSHLIVSIEFNDKLDSIYNNIQHFNIEDNENQPNLNDIENLGVDLWNATTKYKNNKILSLESFNNLALTNARRVSYELIKLGKYHDKKYLSELCYKISLEYLNSNDLKLAEDYLNELNNLNGSSLDRNVQNEDAIKQAMLKIKLFMKQNKLMLCLTLINSLLDTPNNSNLPIDLAIITTVINDLMEKLLIDKLNIEVIELGKKAIKYFSNPNFNIKTSKINGEVMCFMGSVFYLTIDKVKFLLVKGYLNLKGSENLKYAEDLIATIEQNYSTASILSVKFQYLKQNNKIEEIPNIFSQYMQNKKIDYNEVEKLIDIILSLGEDYDFDLAIKSIDNILNTAHIQENSIYEKIALLKVYFIFQLNQDITTILLQFQEIHQRYIKTTKALEALKLILWEKADFLFESKSYNESFELYYHSLSSFYKSNIKKGEQAVIIIKMAICKVESKDYTKALELLNEAKLIDPGNEYIKIYSIILKLKENSNPQDFYDWGLEEFFQKTDTEIIIFLCQSAHFEKNKAVFFLFIDTALKCFEKASKYNQNDALMMIKLSRICLNDILNDENIKLIDQEIYMLYSRIIKLISYVDKMHNKELEYEKEQLILQIWNIGFQKFKKGMYESSEIFFNLIKKILKDNIPNEGQIFQMASVTILSATSCLLNKTINITLLNEHYLSCQKIFDKVINKFQSNNNLNEQLCLILFQLVIKLNKWNELENLIDKFNELFSNFSNLFYERLLDVILLESNCPKAVMIKCIQKLMNELLKNNNISIPLFSKWMHILVYYSLSINHEAGFAYIKQAIAIIDANHNEYPKDEIQWLSIASWNHGITKLNIDRNINNKIWFEYAIQIGSYLKDKSIYNKMIQCFDEIIKQLIE